MAIFDGYLSKMPRTVKTMKRRMAGAYISSLLSISLVLVLVGAAALLLVNARRVSDYFRENMRVSVLLYNDVSEKAAEALKAEVDSLPFTHSATLITREQGTRELQQMLGEDFLNVFESTPVPLSLELTLKAPYVSADSLEKVKSALKASPLVEDVDSRSMLVEALNSNISRISLILAVLTVLMLFISVVLISNTVRLGLHARRFSIHTMQLVGATRGFIRKPFLARALVQGLLASLIAIAVLGAGLWFAWKGFPQLFGIIRPSALALVALIIIVCGVGICLISTWFVVNRLVAMDNDELFY